MTETKGIHRLVIHARRRLRLKAALDAAVFTVTPAALSALVVTAAVRLGALGPITGNLLVFLCAAAPLCVAALQIRKRFATHIVATQIDRASNLSDRLASACDFEQQLGRSSVIDAETQEFMHAAIADAAAHVGRADVKAATQFGRPFGSYPALGAVAAAILVALFFHPTRNAVATHPPGSIAPSLQEKDQVELDPEELQFQRDVIEELRRTAIATHDEELKAFADQLDQIVAEAQKGQLGKQEMLAKLAEAEKKYAQSSEEDAQHALAELGKTGRELEKAKLGQKLGQALTKNDLEAAQKELGELAAKLDQKQLSDQQQKELAQAMKKAADAFDQRNQEQKQADQNKVETKKAELERLKDKLDKAKNDRDKAELSQELQRKKRELDKLEREDQRKNESAQRRHLEELHRDLRKAAEQMQQGNEEGQRQASRTMRDIQRSTGKVDQDQRKLANQKKVASQLSDLREAMRRAKRKQNGDPQDQFGKNQRNRATEDFITRARGGSRSQSGQPNGQSNGQNQGGPPGKDGYGDEHDPNLYGDATKKTGNTKDVGIQGSQGKNGSSIKETILSAAEKGFASQSYKQVYARYQPLVEEVISSENVPSGYKYYVKRYFHQIKPQE